MYLRFYLNGEKIRKAKAVAILAAAHFRQGNDPDEVESMVRACYRPGALGEEARDILCGIDSRIEVYPSE